MVLRIQAVEYNVFAFSEVYFAVRCMLAGKARQRLVLRVTMVDNLAEKVD